MIHTSCSQGLTHAQWGKQNKITASSSRVIKNKRNFVGVGKKKKKNIPLNAWTSYHYAAYYGLPSEVVKLKNFKADPNTKGKYKIIPLHFASFFDHPHVISLLLDRGADAVLKNVNGYTSFHFAAANGSTDALECLLLNLIKQSIPHDGFDTIESFLSEQIKQGQTDLPNLSVGSNKIDVANIFSLLVQAPGINTYAADDGSTTASVHTNTALPSVLDLLTSIFNSDLNIRKDNITMLHCSAYHGHKKLTKMLIKAGADIEAKTNNSIIPLHFAFYFDHADIVRLFFNDSRTNKKIKDLYGNTLLHFAAMNGSVAVCTQFPEILHDVNIQNDRGATPLHFAALRGDDQFCNILLNSEANINAKGPNGRTPAHYAAIQGHRIVMDTLKQCGADLSIPDSNGITPNGIWQSRNQH